MVPRQYARVLVVAMMALCGSPVAVSAQPYGYVTSRGSNTLTVIDIKTNAVVTTISVASPMGVALTPDGSRAYVVSAEGNILVVNTSTNTVVATVPVGASPLGIAVSPDGSRV